MADLSAGVTRGSTRSAIMPPSYSTAFPLTENPINESGRWLGGLTNGLLWKDVKTVPGLASATGSSAAPPYDDPTAILTGFWHRDQTVEATVVIPSTQSGSQEIELRLQTRVLANRIVGYEVLFSTNGGNHYADIERWDGGTSISDFTSVIGGFITMPQALATGNRVKATITAAGVITAYVDFGGGYVQIMQGTDTTYPPSQRGAPGIGFFWNGGGSNDFGFSTFSATGSSL